MVGIRGCARWGEEEPGGGAHPSDLVRQQLRGDMGALEAGTLYVTLGVDITQLTEGLATGAARFSAFAQGAQQAIASATQGMQAAAQSLAGAATSGEAATGRIAAG